MPNLTHWKPITAPDDATLARCIQLCEIIQYDERQGGEDETGESWLVWGRVITEMYFDPRTNTILSKHIRASGTTWSWTDPNEP